MMQDLEGTDCVARTKVRFDQALSRHVQEHVERVRKTAKHVHHGTGLQAYFHAPSKKEPYVELPEVMWTSNCPQYARLRVSLFGTRDAAANWEDAHAKILPERVFARGVASPCSFYSRERNDRVGFDFLSGGPRRLSG